MEKMIKHIAAVVLCLSSATAVQARDWVVGVGVLDYSENAASTEANLSVEVYSNPFAEVGRLSFGAVAGASVSTEGDVWIGVGVAALYDRNRWFVEASVMPGYYNEGSDATDLGSALEFRSLIGVGYVLNPTTRVSIAIDHKSNANIGSTNPGVNSVSLRLRKSF